MGRVEPVCFYRPSHLHLYNWKKDFNIIYQIRHILACFYCHALFIGFFVIISHVKWMEQQQLMQFSSLTPKICIFMFCFYFFFVIILQLMQFSSPWILIVVTISALQCRKINPKQWLLSLYQKNNGLEQCCNAKMFPSSPPDVSWSVQNQLYWDFGSLIDNPGVQCRSDLSE